MAVLNPHTVAFLPLQQEIVGKTPLAGISRQLTFKTSTNEHKKVTQVNHLLPVCVVYWNDDMSPY